MVTSLNETQEMVQMQVALLQVGDAVRIKGHTMLHLIIDQIFDDAICFRIGHFSLYADKQKSFVLDRDGNLVIDTIELENDRGTES